MSTVVNFKGRKVTEPGVYAQIKSGVPAKLNDFSFGDVLLIDTGKGKGWGGGSGVNGVHQKGLNSMYSFEDVDDFKGFVKGGLFYDLADFIFNPLNGASGPSLVYFARACTTNPSNITLNFGDNSNGGSVEIITVNEGDVSNGLLNETLGKALVRINRQTLVLGNTIKISVGDVELVDYTVDSILINDFLNDLSESINSSETGYTAKIQGTTLVILSKPNQNPENLELNIEGTVELDNSSNLNFNGYKAGTNLIKGYGAIIQSSDLETGKFVLKILEGSFAGYSSEQNSINGLTELESKPNLVFQSEPFNTLDELISYIRDDFGFNKLFRLGNFDIFGNGDVTISDNLDTIILASGGYENYNANDLDKLLQDSTELQNTFILSDNFESEALGVVNMKILDYIQNNSEFDKFLVIGGGSDETKFDIGSDSSIEISKAYDSTSVIVVHGGFERFLTNSQKSEKLPSIYHAANFVGRLGGLQPQEPITFKALKIKNFIHNLNQKQREKALKYGVIHNRYVPGIGNVVNQGINTIQKNSQLINPDGTSFEISIMRIGAQLNKELILNMRPLFVGNNWGKSSPEDVKTFVEGFLLNKTATNNQDNLIISFKNVTVRLIEDYYDIKYAYVPNGPLNKLFVTGFMLDANLSS